MKRGTVIFVALFLVAAISLFAIIFVLPKFEAKDETVVLQHGTLPVSDDLEAVIVRDETLYTASNSGTPSYNEKEGAKVRVGTQVMSVDSASGEDSKGDAEIAKDYVADRSAMVSYYSDGLEEELLPEKRRKLMRSQVKDFPKAAKKLKANSVKRGDPIYKLTDGSLWYIVFWLDADSGSRVHYDTGKELDVDFGDDRVPATVDSITDDGGDFRIILKCGRYYESMMVKRRTDVSIILSEYDGLVVDSSCVSWRGDKPGVFVKQISGNFRWVPVKIDDAHSTGSKYIVSVGTFRDENENSVNTVNYYDEVLKNPLASGYK